MQYPTDPPDSKNKRARTALEFNFPGEDPIERTLEHGLFHLDELIDREMRQFYMVGSQIKARVQQAVRLLESARRQNAMRSQSKD